MATSPTQAILAPPDEERQEYGYAPPVPLSSVPPVGGGTGSSPGSSPPPNSGVLAPTFGQGSNPAVAAPAVPAPIAPPAAPTPKDVKNVDEEQQHGFAANILAGGMFQSPPQLARNILLGN